MRKFRYIDPTSKKGRNRTLFTIVKILTAWHVLGYIIVTKIVANKPVSDVPKIPGFQDIRVPKQNVDCTINTDKTTKNS